MKHLAVILALSAPFALAQEKPASANTNTSPNAAPPTPATTEDRRLESVDVHKNEAYANNSNTRQMLDLYLPKAGARDGKPLSVVVYIHGGGWRGGDRSGGGNNVLPFVLTGQYAGVSVGYRLSNEALWPAQIHDCKAAIRWLRGNAKKYNLDPERIAVWGTSAGGHLVSLLGTTAGDKELDGSLGSFSDLSTRVTCVVNQCGPSDMTVPLRPNAKGDAVDEAVAGLIGGSPKEKPAEAKASSPITHVTADDAPFLHVHGRKDERVEFPQSVKFHAALKGAGVSTTLSEIPDAGHGIPMTRELRQTLQQFIDLHLRDIKSGIDSRSASQPVTR